VLDFLFCPPYGLYGETHHQCLVKLNGIVVRRFMEAMNANPS
jgi:hypothetical protein